MLKGKGFDSEGTFKSIIGFSDSSETKPEPNLQPPKEQNPPQVAASTPGSGIARPRPKPIVAAKTRPKGRPKINREMKKRYTFTILPSVYDEAAGKADDEGYSLSEVVSFLLSEYARKD